MKALEGATWDRFLFMTNQTTRAAIIPRPARPPTTPPAMAPALEPPPWDSPWELLFVVRGLLVPVPVLVELVELGRVATGGVTPVDSGWSTTALEAFRSHLPVSVTLRYAQCGMEVSAGISNGYWVT